MSRQARTHKAPMRSRCSSPMPGAGASSITFWWRRCMEQSRSPRWMALPLRVGQHLEFHVARPGEEFLHVQPRVAERRLGLAAG